VDQAWLFDAGSPAPRRGVVRRRPSPEELLEACLRDVSSEEERRYVLGSYGWTFVDGGQFEAARAVARQILDLDPRDMEGLCMRAHADVGLGDLDAAEETLATARLLVRGPRKHFYQERVVELAELIHERRQRQRTRRPARPPARRRRKRERAARARRTVELARPPEHEPTHTLEPRRLVLPPTDEVPPQIALADYRLRREAVRVDRLRSFETLLALSSVTGVDHYEYQLRAVRRVLRDFRGRVLLADEVGLGKTVEACLCLKEYVLRGLVRRALVLVPPGLVGQWRDELIGKFGIEPRVVDGEAARTDANVWDGDGVFVASLGLVRLERHARRLRKVPFDLVVVDEAHRLKNRRTRSWKLVDALRSRFLLLLSATPVENDLVEIYNVLSLLRPGLFSTEAEFRKTFVGSGPGRAPRDPGQLRGLLREVMIRNTRALAEANLPPRFAATLRAEPEGEEAALHRDVSAAVKEALHAKRLRSATAGEILRALAACAGASTRLVERHLSSDLAARAASAGPAAKDALLVDLLAKRKGEKVLVFAGHRKALDHVLGVVERAGSRPALFHGSLSAGAKRRAVEAFAADADVLVASESGGEGFNLQFARTVVNYDLPWNPMRIEQRIGRVHRIGQARDVFVFNLVTAGTLEEEILRVLDEKINMFELVVGEIDAILGRLGDDEKEFSELVLDIYAAAGDRDDLRARFDALAERMVAARGEYARVKELEDRLFGRDLEA